MLSDIGILFCLLEQSDSDTSTYWLFSKIIDLLVSFIVCFLFCVKFLFHWFLYLCGFFFTVYFWERETERQRQKQSMNGRGAERERHRIWSRFQTLSCQHRALHRAPIHEPWDHDLSWSQMLNQLTHLGAPRGLSLSIHSTDQCISGTESLQPQSK